MRDCEGWHTDKLFSRFGTNRMVLSPVPLHAQRHESGKDSRVPSVATQLPYTRKWLVSDQYRAADRQLEGRIHR